MKKIITIILCLSLIVPMFYLDSAQALPIELPEINLNNETITEIEYLENGDYIVTSLLVETDLDLSAASTNDDTFYKNAAKSSVYYNSANEALWKITISAKFKCVPYVSCTLVSYSGSGTSYNSNWKVHDVVASQLGQTAVCTGQGTHYFLPLMPLETVNARVTLACNTVGNIV